MLKKNQRGDFHPAKMVTHSLLLHWLFLLLDQLLNSICSQTVNLMKGSLLNPSSQGKQIQTLKDSMEELALYYIVQSYPIVVL